MSLVNSLLKNKLLSQILKFIVVGGTSFLIDYYLMIFLKDVFNVYYLIASVAGFCVSVIYNYILSSFWVFDMDKSKPKTQTFIIFVVLSVLGLLINTAVLYILVDGLSLLRDNYGKIVATAVVMVYNFITRKIFLEK